MLERYPDRNACLEHARSAFEAISERSHSRSGTKARGARAFRVVSLRDRRSNSQGEGRGTGLAASATLSQSATYFVAGEAISHDACVVVRSCRVTYIFGGRRVRCRFRGRRTSFTRPATDLAAGTALSHMVMRRSRGRRSTQGLAEIHG